MLVSNRAAPKSVLLPLNLGILRTEVRRMRLFTLAKTAAVAAGAALVLVGAVNAAPGDTDMSMPITRELENPCIPGESVFLQGTMRIVTHTTTNDGGVHTVYNTYFTGFHGVGFPSGSDYVSNEEQTGSSFVSSDAQPQVFTAERTFLLTRLGENGIKLDDFFQRVIAHTTTNANGDITGSQFDFEETCR
jgi:hypothetical protein